MATLLAAVAGCAEEDSIRIYRVAKDESRGSRTTATSTLVQSGKEQIMLGAIVPNKDFPEKDFICFFKIAGEPDVVAKNGDSFRQMVESVVFDANSQPSWKLAEGWQEVITKADMRYATLTHAESGLTASVSLFPYVGVKTQEGWQEYVVSNVNRWRKQLSLQEQPWREIANDLDELPELSQDSFKAYYVSLAGKSSGSSGMAPFMNMGGAVPAGAHSGSAPTEQASPTQDQSTNTNASSAFNQTAESPAEKPINYQVPDGWSETSASGMRMAAFDVVDGDTKGEVTIITAGGSINDNLSIWLGQVGAESTEESKQSILKAVEEVAVNKVTAKLYSIDGAAPPNAAGAAATGEGAAGQPTAQNSILIAEIPWREKMSLFVKYKGPTTLAIAQREKFVNFVKSIEWKE